jgi:type IV secretion system protein TrbL
LWLFNWLVPFTMILSGALAWAWGDEPHLMRALIRRVLIIGFAYYLITNWHTITMAIASGMVKLGLQVGGSGLTQDVFWNKPSVIWLDGVTLANKVSNTCTLCAFVPGIGGMFLFAYFIGSLFVLVAFGYLAITVFIATLEFKLVTLASVIFLPFSIWEKTAFLSERAIGYIFSFGAKILVLAIVIGVGHQLVQNLYVSATPSWTNLESVVFCCFAVMALGFSAPKVAAALVSGGPQVGAASAIAPPLAVGGAVATMGLGAAVAARSTMSSMKAASAAFSTTRAAGGSKGAATQAAALAYFTGGASSAAKPAASAAATATKTAASGTAAAGQAAGVSPASGASSAPAPKIEPTAGNTGGAATSSNDGPGSYSPGADRLTPSTPTSEPSDNGAAGANTSRPEAVQTGAAEPQSSVTTKAVQGGSTNSSASTASPASTAPTGPSVRNPIPSKAIEETQKGATRPQASPAATDAQPASEAATPAAKAISRPVSLAGAEGSPMSPAGAKELVEGQAAVAAGEAVAATQAPSSRSELGIGPSVDQAAPSIATSGEMTEPQPKAGSDAEPALGQGPGSYRPGEDREAARPADTKASIENTTADQMAADTPAHAKADPKPDAKPQEKSTPKPTFTTGKVAAATALGAANEIKNLAEDAPTGSMGAPSIHTKGS